MLKIDSGIIAATNRAFRLAETALTSELVQAASEGTLRDVFFTAKNGGIEITGVRKAYEATVLFGHPVIGAISGVIVTPLGHVVTCAHGLLAREYACLYRDVIYQDKPVSVSGMEYVYHDPSFADHNTGDLAVLLVPALAGKPYVPLRTTPIEIGELGFAVGHPKELDHFSKEGTPVNVKVVSVGHITHRSQPSLLETDIMVSCGYSGGPLVDAQGQLMGITARLNIRTGGGLFTSLVQDRLVPGRPSCTRYASKLLKNK